jgi:tetratricopeptide (TPR) repeat protein
MLPASLIDEIQSKLDQGDACLDADEFAAAIAFCQQAVSLIPAPKHSHDISLSAFTALGEAYFFSGYYQDALAAFSEALKSPGGVENPLLHLRRGQAYFENGDPDRAADSLTRAYALDGRDVFDGEDDKYLSFLATKIEL